MLIIPLEMQIVLVFGIMIAEMLVILALVDRIIVRALSTIDRYYKNRDEND